MQKNNLVSITFTMKSSRTKPVNMVTWAHLGYIKKACFNNIQGMCQFYKDVISRHVYLIARTLQNKELTRLTEQNAASVSINSNSIIVTDINETPKIS
jgi:hypothetical protein